MSQMIFLSSFLNILFFGLIIFGLTMSILIPSFTLLSNTASSNLADEINEADKVVIGRIDDEWINEHIDPDFSNAEDEVNKKVKIEGSPSELLYIDIKAGGKTIYSNRGRLDYKTPIGLVNKLIESYDIQSKSPIYDSNDKIYGDVTVGISPRMISIISAVAFAVFTILIVFALFITMLMSRLFAIPAVKPLKKLESKMNALANGDFESVIQTEVAVKRPFREIESLIDSTNIIMGKMKHYAAELESQKGILEDQNAELETQNDELIQSKQKIQEAQMALEQREKSLVNLLNNVNQGYLTFDKDLLVDAEFSLQSQTIFGRDITACYFPELLAPGDEEQRSFLQRLFLKIFEEQSEWKREMYLPLLPGELNINGRDILFDYRIIPDHIQDQSERLMVIMTDITDKKSLESLVEEERNHLKMVVKVVMNYEDYLETTESFKLFAGKKLFALLEQARPLKDILLEIYRMVHTYKGSFAQLEMGHIVSYLHSIETNISQMVKKPDQDKQGARAYFKDLDLEGFLQNDIDLLHDILGESFFTQNQQLGLDKIRLAQLEKKMIRMLSPAECNLLIPELRSLRYEPFRELVNSYPSYINRLAESYEKLIHPVVVSGGEFLIDKEKYQPFTKSLIHVFRNAIDHGIEYPQERLEAGKDALSQCVISHSILPRHTSSASRKPGCLSK